MGFNGAVLHRHGWRQAPRGHELPNPASMGPCFIGTDGRTMLEDRSTALRLQWGRASSARMAWASCSDVKKH